MIINIETIKIDKFVVTNMNSSGQGSSPQFGTNPSDNHMRFVPVVTLTIIKQALLNRFREGLLD